MSSKNKKSISVTIVVMVLLSMCAYAYKLQEKQSSSMLVPDLAALNPKEMHDRNFQNKLSPSDSLLNVLKTKADKGDAYAALVLAYGYFLGNIVDKDLKKSAYWCEKAWKNGNEKVKSEADLLWILGNLEKYK